MIKFKSRIKFSKLLRLWRDFHYLQIEPGSRDQYDKALVHLKFFDKFSVNKIDSSAVDHLIVHWRSPQYLKDRARLSFRRELSVLRQILNFYRKRFRNVLGSVNASSRESNSSSET